MMKIKQIELKDVDLTTLNENEIYYCELNNYYIQDLYYEQIVTLLKKIRKQSDVVSVSYTHLDVYKRQ